MQENDEYIKLIADLMDLRLQLIYLLQQQQSMSEDLKTIRKESADLKEEILSKPMESVTDEDCNKLQESKSKLQVMLEIFDMYEKMYVKKNRKSLEIQKKIEQYCKRHNKSLPSWIKKQI